MARKGRTRVNSLASQAEARDYYTNLTHSRERFAAALRVMKVVSTPGRHSDLFSHNENYYWRPIFYLSHSKRTRHPAFSEYSKQLSLVGPAERAHYLVSESEAMIRV